jgi:hypothetical protein
LSSGSDRWIQRFTAPGCQQQLVGGSPVFEKFKTGHRTNDFSCEKSRYLSSAGLFFSQISSCLSVCLSVCQ